MSWTQADTMWTIGIVYSFVAFMAVTWVLIYLDRHPSRRGWAVAAVFWPITLIILSPVLLVKLVAVTFKRRGLVSSWFSVITNTYKGAVK